MAAGILGEADLLANTPTKLYTVPPGKVATITVSFCNRSTSTIKATLRTPLTVGALNTYYEFETPVLPGGGMALERSGIVLEAGRNVMVQTDKALVTAIVHGFEEEA